MIPIIWFALCFILFLASVDATATATATATTTASPPPPSYVRNLNIDNMDQSIQYDADHGRDTIIHFFEPWSGHCKHFNITWEKFATEMHSTLTIARVNAIRDQQLSMRLDFRGGTTIHLFRKGMVYQYENNRTIDALQSWIQHQGWTSSSHIRPYSTCIPPHTITSIPDTDMEYDHAFESRSHVYSGIYPSSDRSTFTLFCDSLTNCECRKLEFVWARVADDLQDFNMTWVTHINTAIDHDVQVATRLGITTFPSIAYIHQGRVYYYDGDILNTQLQPQTFTDWIRNEDWMLSTNAPLPSSFYSYQPPQPCNAEHPQSFTMYVINKIHTTCDEIWKDLQLVWTRHVISSTIIFTVGGIFSLMLTALLTWLCGNTSTRASTNTTSTATATGTESGSVTTTAAATSTISTTCTDRHSTQN